MVTMTTLCSRARASLCSFSIVWLIYILCVFTRALYLCAQPQAPQQSALHMKGPRSARHNQPPGVVGTGTQMQQTQIPRIKRDNHPKFICSSTGRRLFSSLSLFFIYIKYMSPPSSLSFIPSCIVRQRPVFMLLVCTQMFSYFIQRPPPHEHACSSGDFMSIFSIGPYHDT